MARPITVTVDTNILDDASLARLHSAAEDSGLLIEILPTTVNVRERGGDPGAPAIAETAVWGESRWGEALWADDQPISETLVLGETQLGDGTLADVAGMTRFETILTIVSGGSFPKQGDRDCLTKGQQRQLRDAMTLEAHARERRDVFVTGDRRGFVNHGRRDMFEQLCSTRIVTLDEVGVSWP